MTPTYEVIVGNIGTVYRGSDSHLAYLEFYEFARLSKDGYGWAAGEPVTLLEDGEIIKEHASVLA